MSQHSVSVKQGTITTFDVHSGKGRVRVETRELPFDETCFRSGRPIRSPQPGEEVDAIFVSDGGLLSLRSRE